MKSIDVAPLPESPDTEVLPWDKGTSFTIKVILEGRVVDEVVEELTVTPVT